MVVPPRVPEVVFTGWLADFMDAYPEVSVDVVATDVHVDLVAEGFDLALRYGPIDDASLVARTLATNATIAVASPAYIDAHGMPPTAGDLRDHNCLIGYAGKTQPDPRWPLLDGGWVGVEGDLKTNHAGLRLEAALRGLGIDLVVEREVAKWLESGELVQVLPDIIGRRDQARIVYPDREFLDPKVRAFVDFLTSRVVPRPALDS